MATQTFSRMLLYVTAILTALVTIPVAITGVGGTAAEQDYGAAVVASGLLAPGRSRIGVTMRDVEEGEDSSEGGVHRGGAAGEPRGNRRVRVGRPHRRVRWRACAERTPTHAARARDASGPVRSSNRGSRRVARESERGAGAGDEAVRALDHGVRDFSDTRCAGAPIAPSAISTSVSRRGGVGSV